MEDKQKIQVSKLEVATRQLESAIELWFLDKDEISIHTLIAAAYTVIYDVNKHRGTLHEALFDTPIIKDEYRKDWVRKVKEPSNFFKHADKDPEGIVDFFPISNMMFMLYASTGLSSLGVESPYVRIFSIWLYLHEPRFLSPLGLKAFGDRIPVKDAFNLRPLAKKEFFEILIRAAFDFHAGGKK